MKTKIYSLIMVACLGMTSLTSCLDYTDLDGGNMPKSVAIDMTVSDNATTATSVYLSGISDRYDKDAYFLLSLSSDMENAIQCRRLGYTSGNSYQYWYTYSNNILPSTTYYYQLVVADTKSPVGKVTTKSPTVSTANYSLSSTSVTLYGYSSYKPSKAYFLLSKSEDMSNGKTYEASIYYDSGSRYRCSASVADIETDTQYYYRLVIIYANGNGESIQQEADVATFHTVSNMKVASILAKDFSGETYNPEEVNILVVSPNGNTFNTVATYSYASGNTYEWKLKNSYSFSSSNYSVYAYTENIKWISGTSATISSGTNAWCYYGKQTGLNSSNSEVNIEMTNALAQVIIQLQTEKEAPETRAIKQIIINSQELSASATLNMQTGAISNRHALNTFSLPTNISLKTTPVTQTIYLVPTKTSSTGTSLTFLLEDEKTKSVYFPSIEIEAGKRYTIPVTITDAEMYVGEVSVSEWQNGGNGTITIQ